MLFESSILKIVPPWCPVSINNTNLIVCHISAFPSNPDGSTRHGKPTHGVGETGSSPWEVLLSHVGQAPYLTSDGESSEIGPNRQQSSSQEPEPHTL